jgi:hypothetical protein
VQISSACCPAISQRTCTPLPYTSVINAAVNRWISPGRYDKEPHSSASACTCKDKVLFSYAFSNVKHASDRSMETFQNTRSHCLDSMDGVMVRPCPTCGHHALPRSVITETRVGVRWPSYMNRAIVLLIVNKVIHVQLNPT